MGWAEVIKRARVYPWTRSGVAGGKRHLAFFPDWPGVLQQLTACYWQQKTVVLAFRAPLFYGVGRLLLEAFPKDDVVFLPHVSSVQLAFARLKASWHNACVVKPA